MELNDKELTCVECKDEFVFSAGEQQFFHDKQLSEPKRCKACRQAAKNRKERYE